MNRLVVDKHSWHYKYYLAVRRGWQSDFKQSQTSSLCPYVQTMIWGSVAAVVLFPLMVFGWLFVKTGRTVYKLLEKTRPGRRVIDFLDNFGFGSFLSMAPEMMEESLFFGTALAGMTGVLYIFVPPFAAFVLGVMLTSDWFAMLADLPAYLWQGLLWIGWGLLWLPATVGWLMHGVWFIVCWLAAVASNVTVWYYAGVSLLTLVGVAAMSVIIGYIVHWLAQWEVTQTLWEYFVFRYNGFTVAREQAVARREEQAKAKPKKRRKKSWLSKCWKVLRDFFFSNTRWVGDGCVKVLSPVALLWEFAKAIKQRACPMVQFVDVETEDQKE